MAILCESIGLLFVQTPLTGSFATSHFLVEKFGGVEVGEGHDTTEQLYARGALSGMKLGKLIKVATIRNPFDKVASHYFKHSSAVVAATGNPVSQWCMEFRPSFEQYIEEVFLKRAGVAAWAWYFPSQKGAYGDWAWIKGVDVILRYEQFEMLLAKLLRQLGIPNMPSIPARNITPKKIDYRTLHTDRTRFIIGRAYEQYLAFTGYGFMGNRSTTPML